MADYKLITPSDYKLKAAKVEKPVGDPKSKEEILEICFIGAIGVTYFGTLATLLTVLIYMVNTPARYGSTAFAGYGLPFLLAFITFAALVVIGLVILTIWIRGRRTCESPLTCRQSKLYMDTNGHRNIGCPHHFPQTV